MTAMTKECTDMINHPPHYQGAGGRQVIEVIDDLGIGQAYAAGCVVKYLLRAGRKGGPGDARADLRKAGWYLARLIEEVEFDGAWPLVAALPMGYVVQIGTDFCEGVDGVSDVVSTILSTAGQRDPDVIAQRLHDAAAQLGEIITQMGET